MTRVAALALAALLALTLLLPVAAADHAYSHRYIIYGRVVDANGDPVRALTVNIATRDFEPEGQCGTQPGTDTDAFGVTRTEPQTNDYGEFIFCYHTHALPRALPGSATVSIPEANYTQEVTFDPYFREMFLPIQLPDVQAGANKDVQAVNYTVLGRLWRPTTGDTTLESIRVYGLAVANQNVVVTLALDDGTKVVKNATTNNYGDFSLRFPVNGRPTGGTVTIQAGDYSESKPVDAKMGVTSFKSTLPKQTDPFVRTALIGLGVVVGLGVIGGAGWYGYKRVATKREIEQVRARSTRKRANR